MKGLNEFLNEGFLSAKTLADARSKFYVEKDGKYLTNHGMKKLWFVAGIMNAYAFKTEAEAEKYAKEYGGKAVSGKEAWDSSWD